MLRRTLGVSFLVALLHTVGALGVWAATGGHPYTKFKVVETVEEEVAADDPLAQTGFYEGSTQERTIEREEFHLGIFPTPQGLFDKHLISVVTILVPIWGVFGLLAWRSRRSRQGNHGEKSDPT
jgi:hypothetical protein